MSAVGQDDQTAVAVKIDEAGGDDLPGCIDRAADLGRPGRIRCQYPQPFTLDDHRPGATWGAGPIHIVPPLMIESTLSATRRH